MYYLLIIYYTLLSLCNTLLIGLCLYNNRRIKPIFLKIALIPMRDENETVIKNWHLLMSYSSLILSHLIFFIFYSLKAVVKRNCLQSS